MKGGSCVVKLEQIQTHLEQWRLIFFRASVVRQHSETLIKTSEAGGNKWCVSGAAVECGGTMKGPSGSLIARLISEEGSLPVFLGENTLITYRRRIICKMKLLNTLYLFKNMFVIWNKIIHKKKNLVFPLYFGVIMILWECSMSHNVWFADSSFRLNTRF